MVRKKYHHLISFQKMMRQIDKMTLLEIYIAYEILSLAYKLLIDQSEIQIPRRKGDTENPRGGVRGVIKDKQDY